MGVAYPARHGSYFRPWRVVRVFFHVTHEGKMGKHDN
jgi:hypothetical protein